MRCISIRGHVYTWKAAMYAMHFHMRIPLHLKGCCIFNAFPLVPSGLVPRTEIWPELDQTVTKVTGLSVMVSWSILLFWSQFANFTWLTITMWDRFKLVINQTFCVMWLGRSVLPQMSFVSYILTYCENTTATIQLLQLFQSISLSALPVCVCAAIASLCASMHIILVWVHVHGVASAKHC